MLIRFFAHLKNSTYNLNDLSWYISFYCHNHNEKARTLITEIFINDKLDHARVFDVICHVMHRLFCINKTANPIAIIGLL